ncbi:MAG: PEP/pyruvate-binding domain-containing protein [Hespellia sp.]|nr:PEP/pyruvate-binding domain-containing protein [Hespellia sp.]
MKYLVKLQELKKDDVRTGGGKASNLGELLRGGFQVPEGFCVNSAGFWQFIKSNNIDSEIEKVVNAANDDNRTELHELIENLKQIIKAGNFSEDLRTEIESLYNELLKGKKVAVRSSATAEDLKDASFAGQQETYLGVIGIDELMNKIKECFASLYDDRAILYRKKMGFNSLNVALAVVVQAMIGSDVSGVSFTENPVSRNSDEIMLNASYGLGESIVSGQVNPDIFIYSKSKKEIVSKTLGSKQTAIYMNANNGTDIVETDVEKRKIYSLTNEQIAEIAEVSEKIEAMYKMPMDIEWAYENGKLYILQARAVTTLNTETKTETKTETATQEEKNDKQEKSIRMQMNNLIEHCPITPYPLDFGPFMTVMNAKQVIFAEHGIVQDDVLLMDDDGLILTNVKKPKYKLSVVKLPFQMKGFLEFDINKAESEKSLEKAKNDIAGIDPYKIPEDSIQKTIAKLLDIAKKLSYARFRYAIFPYVCQAEFMERLLHKVDSKLSNYDLMCDLSYKTRDMNMGLAKLAKLIKEDSELKKIYEEGMASEDYEFCIEEMKKASDAFTLQIDLFLAEFGWKSDNSYVAFSTTSWNENKASLFSLLSVFVRAEASMSSNESRYVSIMKDIDSKLSAKEATKLKTKIENNRKYHVLREESLYLLETCYGYSRILLRRLIDGKFKEILSFEEALYLTEKEICTVSPNQIISMADKIALRNENRKKNQIIWENLEAHREDHSVTVLYGVSGNLGKVTGKVKIIQSISEFGKIQEGEVLVCRYTDPEWTPLFLIASAVISDTGGPLSHSAIVAREYGIPAVLATGDATKRLYDGSLVEVDGDKGVVNVLH